MSERWLFPQRCNSKSGEYTERRCIVATDSVYRITEIVGTSKDSWEDAARNAVKTAARTLRDLRVAEIVKLDMVIEDGEMAAYRARVNLSFKYEGKDM
jgi:flavin-binding protein dodecin